MANLPSRKHSKGDRPSTQWTSNLKGEDAKKEFLRALEISNTPVLRRLLEIVQEKRDISQHTNTTDYNSPSWAYIQADKAGYTRALHEVERLLMEIVK